MRMHAVVQNPGLLFVISTDTFLPRWPQKQLDICEMPKGTLKDSFPAFVDIECLPKKQKRNNKKMKPY